MNRVANLRESFRVSGLNPRAASIEMFSVDVRNALDPHSWFIKTWHQVLLAGVVYEFFVVPFMFTFKPHAALKEAPEVIVFYVCEILFFLDFYVKLNTGFYEDGNVHQDLRRARMKYLKSAEFAMDAVSIVPFSLLPLHLSVSPMVLEVPKILRLWRLPKYLTNLDDLYARHFEVLKLSKLVVGIILLSHSVACVRFAFGYDEHHYNHWLPRVPEHEQLPQSKYLMSLFWAFGILSGLFEGELPHSIAEFIFTIFVALCGFSIFTSLCATFFMLSKCESGETEAAEGRINQLKHILEFHRVSESLQVQAIEYLRLYYTDADSNEREVMKLLCPSIATDIQIELMKDTVSRVPLFSDCKDEFIVALTSLLERISLPAQCTLFQAGDFGDAMYIIHSGVLDVIVGKSKVRELRKNDFVGELSLFSSSPRTATVVTTTYCVLYKLSRFHTEKVLDGYPRVARSISTVVAQFLEKAQEQKAQKDEAAAAAHALGPQVLPSDDAPPSDPKQRRGSVFTAQLSQMIQNDAIGIFRKKTSNAVTPILILPEKAQVQKRASALSSGSPIPLMRRVLTGKKRKGSDSIKVFYDQYATSSSAMKSERWWSSLLLKQCIEAESTRRLWWLLVLQIVLVVNWVVIPLQLAFELFDKPSWYIHTLNTLADIALLADVYVNLNLSYMHDAEKILDPTRSAARYLRSTFLADVVCAFPYWIFAPSVHFAIMRIPRLLRIWRTWGHYQELDKIHHLHSKQRLLIFGIVLFLLIHVVSCLHFSVTHIEGYNPIEDSWIPCTDIELRRTQDGMYIDHLNVTYSAGDPHIMTIASMQYFRSFYYAANVLTGLGRTMEPISDTQYAIALVFMFTGFLITAIVVDNVQKRFTASAYEEKEFFAVRSRIQLFLRRQNAPFVIHQRVNTFLDYWWASHRGALIEELLVDLPLGYRREILRSVCKPALQTLALLLGVRPCLNELEEVFVDNAQFILYGQDEVLYREGDNAHGLFFLLEGSIELKTRTADRPKDVPQGSCFGTQSLQTDDAHTGYAETAVAASGCVVLLFTRQKLEILHNVFPSLESALTRLEKRLLDTKLSKSAFSEHHGHSSRDQQTGWLAACHNSSIDPDSKAMAVWETWLFLAMTVQWVLVILHICFGVDDSMHSVVDGITVFLEAFFLIDIYVRTRLGYHEFGNKVMDVAKIRRKFFRSRNFWIDVVALLPLFALNWIIPAVRLEIFNVNKLLRLLKVPTQFRALEQRYLKFAMELRLFKLFYYTFLLAHIFGSLYFDFASHASQVYSLSSGQTRQTNFGGNKWLPAAEIEHVGTTHQYFASVFWAFGLMSASQQGELPKSSVQCIFSVITMISGFFLFAYVVGNFADIIELVDAENREFNEKLGSMRHLLTHFTISPSIEAKMKTFFFFKRFHSITQEEVLEHCLPPSLVTDIRLINLHAMIEKVPFLGNMDEFITRMLVSHFSQVLILKEDYVYRQGDEGTDMFFVFTGILSVLIPVGMSRRPDYGGRSRASSSRGSAVDIDMKALKQMSEITSGDFFGENALFSDNPRNAYVRAKTSCILYLLSRQSLEMVFELYPDWKKRVLQTVKVQQKQQRLNAPTKDRNHRGEPSQRSERLETSAVAEDELDGGDHMEEIAPLPLRSLQAVVVSRGVLRFVPAWMLSLAFGVEAQSQLHLIWLRIIAACTGYIAVIVPYRIAFDSCDRWTPVATIANLLQVLCTLLFALDIWINWRLKECEVSIEIYEEKHRDSYKSDRMLWDVLATLPIDYMVLPFTSTGFWLCLHRCIKVKNIVHYLNEINRQSVSYEWARFKTIWILYLLAMYWSACVFLGVASHDGYGTEWNGWLPTEDVHITDPSSPSSSQLWLRIFRGMFFAVTAFVKKCRTFVPESTSTDVFSILVCFVGLLVMSFMIGEISSLYISYIGNEVKFRKDQIEVELYLSRWKIGKEMKDRVHLFLSTLWSSHRGVNYQHVFDELPRKVRRETLLHIVELPMKALMGKVFRPLAHGDAASLKVLTNAIADQLRFESYPRGERVVVEGTIPKGMYFVVKGHLIPSSATHSDICRGARYKKGSYFGEQGLLGYSVSKISVRTVKASDLLSLSTDGLLSALQSHSYFSIALKLVKELFTNLRSAHAGEIPRSRDVWASHLKKILVRQRMEWALSLSSSPSSDLGSETQLDSMPPPFLPFSPAAPAGMNGSSAMLPKGATLWSAVLAGVLDTDTPYMCLQMFEAFLELIVPIGELYDKTLMTTRQDSSAPMRDPVLPLGAVNSGSGGAGGGSGSRGGGGGISDRRLKNIVQQIGVGRLAINVVQKLSRQSGKSNTSQRNLNAVPNDDD